MATVDSMIQPESFLSSADLSTKQYHVVVLNTTDQVAVVGAGLKALGVLKNDPAAANRAAAVHTASGRRTMVKAGAAISANAMVATDSSGRIVTAVSGNYILGWAEEAATAADQIITMIWEPHGRL